MRPSLALLLVTATMSAHHNRQSTERNPRPSHAASIAANFNGPARGFADRMHSAADMLQPFVIGQPPSGPMHTSSARRGVNQAAPTYAPTSANRKRPISPNSRAIIEALTNGTLTSTNLQSSARTHPSEHDKLSDPRRHLLANAPVNVTWHPGTNATPPTEDTTHFTHTTKTYPPNNTEHLAPNERRPTAHPGHAQRPLPRQRDDGYSTPKTDPPDRAFSYKRSAAPQHKPSSQTIPSSGTLTPRPSPRSPQPPTYHDLWTARPRRTQPSTSHTIDGHRVQRTSLAREIPAPKTTNQHQLHTATPQTEL